MRALTIRPYLVFFLSTLSSISIATDTLAHTQPLLDGETLISANGSFALGFFTPATNSKNRYVGIWYNKISIQTVVWVANRRNPIVDSPGSLTITPNGTLIINSNNSNVIWSSAATSTISNPIAQILDSGNFVVKEANNDNSEIFAWQSFDHPTDTLLPGMKLGWNLTSGLNRNLTAWASLTDPSPGTYTEALDVRGDPQLFLWAGLTREWRGGPWNGLWFSGIPEMRNASIFSFHFVQTSEEVYYAFHVGDPSTLSRLIVNQTGLIQQFIWIDHSKIWSLFWFNPKDQCDHLSPCGPFGVCNVQDSPICHCLQGFDPKSPANWASGDGSNGCMRRTRLDCRINGTDGFVKLSTAKLPDTSSSTVDMSLSDDDCRAKCLENCSCIAYASANINGTGCIIWTTELTDLREFEFAGQDIYVRLAAADLGSTSDQSQNILAIVVPIVLGGLLLAWIGCCLWSRKDRRRRRAMLGTISFTNPQSYQCTEAKDSELPLFDLGAIIAATNNFSVENKLGEGGFGPVFKGILGDGQEIAVKRLGKTSVQGVDEFRNEIILIAKLQHRNLVRLLGYCIQWGDRMLIYEYMPNGSLDAFLFDKVKCALLNWQTRYNIIMGIARGLLYLHQDSRFRIIHRDLKASNILLDKEMNPKISDFGTARIFGGDETEVNTRKVVGTYGYMSPEYVMDGKFSVKSDVFSFGVLVLEIISGKKNRGVYITQPHLSLLGHAWSLWKAGNVLELVDESMCHSFPLTEVLRCMKVGLLCVQEWAEDRPTMSSVVLMLSSETAMLPDPKQPGFVAPRGPFEASSSTSNEKSSTVNDISVTIFEGR